jgi:hypothetical protein
MQYAMGSSSMVRVTDWFIAGEAEVGRLARATIVSSPQDKTYSSFSR